ncbi:unnamed protein product [Pleuronectes platessa]|uniref:Uncharacterized protein n=1 Tax=Pleuronectes platessa TaxID=8262 RepID=A0A9N7YAK3_PLEPL|nr:unnamed protein product [Pleuronectes platessa]
MTAPSLCGVEHEAWAYFTETLGPGAAGDHITSYGAGRGGSDQPTGSTASDCINMESQGDVRKCLRWSRARLQPSSHSGSGEISQHNKEADDQRHERAPLTSRQRR